VLAYDALVSGQSVRARRDRQNLINKPQLDNEAGTDVGIQEQDVESSEESPPRKVGRVDNSIVAVERQRSVHVPVAVRNEASHLQLAKDTCNDTDMAVDNAEQRSVDVPLSTGNLSSTAKVNITSSHSRHLTDKCNVISATKLRDTSVIDKQKAPAHHLPPAAVSDQPLPKKSHSKASKDCSQLASVTDLSERKTVNKKSVSRQLTAEQPQRENRHDSRLSSTVADNNGKTKCERRTVQSNERKATGNSSKADVSVSDSNVNTAESTTACREQSASLSLDRQATGNCVTLGSMISTAMHRTVTPDANILQPIVARQHQSRVRFEGNHQLF